MWEVMGVYLRFIGACEENEFVISCAAGLKGLAYQYS